MSAGSEIQYPDFGYDVRSAFGDDIDSAFDVVELDISKISHIPNGSPTGFKGVIAAGKLYPRSRLQRGEVTLGFWAGDLPSHSDVLLGKGLREDRQPILKYPYAGRVWQVGGRFAWEEKARKVDVDFWTAIDQLTDVRTMPEHRGLTLALGMAVGQAVMTRMDADPAKTPIEISTVPNFLNGSQPVIHEQLKLPHMMAQALQYIELP